MNYCLLNCLLSSSLRSKNGGRIMSSDVMESFLKASEYSLTLSLDMFSILASSLALSLMVVSIFLKVSC